MKRVVIVGGGITGLSAAHALEKGQERCDVRILEASSQLGGNVRTFRHNGFTIDVGPDSWAASEPHATRLSRELALGDELIGTRLDAQRIHIVWQRTLYPIPAGLAFGVPEIKPLIESELLGWDAKIRAGLDFLVPARRWKDDDDETIAGFVSRRLGGEVSERIAGPLFGGLFAGDHGSLSVRACVPKLVEAEQTYGSLVMAMRALRDKGGVEPLLGGTDGAALLSLKRGVGDLVVNLAHKLRDAEVFTSRPARRIDRLPTGDARGRWVVETSDGSLFADEVILAVPAWAVASLMRDLDPRLSAMCGDLEYASTASILLAYRKIDVRHPLDSFGFLVPRAENRPILACTFVSSKWNHRVPAGQVLLRVSIGGAGNPQVCKRDDEELVRIARAQLLDLLKIDRPPVFSKVFRFMRSSPQPYVGHIPRVRRILERVAVHRGLHVGGNGYVGMGIPDAIKQGEEIAARITPLNGLRHAEV